MPSDARPHPSFLSWSAVFRVVGCTTTQSRVGGVHTISGLRPHRATRCAPCGRSARTSAMSQMTNALRAGPQALRPRRPTDAPHRAPTRLGRRASGRRRVSRGPLLPMAKRYVGAGFPFAPNGAGRRLPRAAIASVSLTSRRAEGQASLSPLQSVAAGAARWGRFGGAPRSAAAGAVRAAHFVNILIAIV
jgi:hypothetical protein